MFTEETLYGKLDSQNQQHDQIPASGFAQDLVASILEPGQNPSSAYEGKVKGRQVHLENPVTDDVARRKRRRKKAMRKAKILNGAGPGVVVENVGMTTPNAASLHNSRGGSVAGTAVVALDESGTNKKPKKTKSVRRKKTLTSKEKKAAGVYEIPKECQR
jgi:hypothetical protein